MTIEIALVISLLGFAVSLYFNITGNNRAERSENKEDAGTIAAVLVKIENIADDIRDIKGDLGRMQIDLKDIVERLVIVEQSSKSGHKRLDAFEDRLVRLESGVK